MKQKHPTSQQAQHWQANSPGKMRIGKLKIVGRTFKLCDNTAEEITHRIGTIWDKFHKLERILSALTPHFVLQFFAHAYANPYSGALKRGILHRRRTFTKSAG